MSILILYVLVILIMGLLVINLLKLDKILKSICIGVTQPELPRKQEYPPFHLEISQFLMELGFSSMILHREEGLSHVVIELKDEMIPICELPKTDYAFHSQEYKNQLETIKQDILNLLKERNLYVENK